MIREIKIENSVFLEVCPLKQCFKAELEPIIDEDDFIIQYYCDKCMNYWNLDDLELRKQVQKTLIDFSKSS